MCSFQNLLLIAAGAAVVSARAIVAQDLSAVLTKIKAVEAATTALTDGVRLWDGTMIGAIGLKGKFSDMTNALSDATTDAQGEAVLNADESYLLTVYVNNLTEKAIDTSDALQSRKSDVEDDGLGGTVQSGVIDLKAKVDAYCDALYKITDTSRKGPIKLAHDKMDTVLQAAIDTFG